MPVRVTARFPARAFPRRRACCRRTRWRRTLRHVPAAVGRHDKPFVSRLSEVADQARVA